MNDITKVENSITKMGVDFNKLASIHGAVNFDIESSFAIQHLAKNNYLLKVATQNSESLRFAILNTATIGVSLNPALKHAYLVPRGGQIVLDISYMGLIHLAYESGGVKFVQAAIVREKDEYQSNGMGEKPTHRFDSFGDRGEIRGAYVVAKTKDGDFIVDEMSIKEIYSIRDRTEAWKAYKSGKSKSCPWLTDEGEMIKKTVIKRAYKTWPKADNRFAEAVAHLEGSEGINYAKEVELGPCTEEQLVSIRELLVKVSRSEEQFTSYFCNVIGREIQNIDQLNTREAETALIQLRDIENKNKAQ